MLHFRETARVYRTPPTASAARFVGLWRSCHCIAPGRTPTPKDSATESASVKKADRSAVIPRDEDMDDQAHEEEDASGIHISVESDLEANDPFDL